MNSKPVDTLDSGEHLTLPEPDPDNITVLTRNLPNTPILPWNHYDSPWQEAEADKSEQDTDGCEQNTENLDQNAEILETSDQTATTDEVDELNGMLDSAATTPDATDEFDGDSALASLDRQEETAIDELTG
ncbi:MAG: hypothetical protein Fur006_28590 [Coleofasciculaceae cyanobacterium]|jgi:hypothetical protein